MHARRSILRWATRGLRRAGRRAFTLAEIIVTVAILGIVALCALPILSGRGDIDAQAVVRRLVTDIGFAQGDAMTRQEYRRIHFLADGSGWCVVAVDAGALAAPFDATAARFVTDPLAGSGAGGALRMDFGRDGRFGDLRIDAVAIDGLSRDLTFDPMGGIVDGQGAASAGGSIVVRSPETGYLIEFSPLTGKVRWSRLGGGSASAQ